MLYNHDKSSVRILLYCYTDITKKIQHIFVERVYEEILEWMTLIGRKKVRPHDS